MQKNQKIINADFFAVTFDLNIPFRVKDNFTEKNIFCTCESV